MKKLLLIAILGLTNISFLYAADDRNVVNAELKSVTVYKSGAELQHITTAILKQGNNELIIDNVSNNIDINSIQIKAATEITIMGVEFANNFIAGNEKTPRVKMLEDSISKVQQSVSKIDLLISNDNDQVEILKLNRTIKGTQTTLTVLDLSKMLDFYKSKTMELDNELATLKDKKKKFTEELSKLKSQVQEEQDKNSTVSGRLTLQLQVAVAGKYDFALSYITPNALWTAGYDIKVENTKSPLHLIYKANVVQTTGIDWKKIKLSLSTSNPGQYGTAPELKSWFLEYNNIMVTAFRANSIMAVERNAVQRDEEVVTNMNYTKKKSFGATAKIASEGNEPLYIVNGKAMESSKFHSIDPQSIKSMDVLKDANATSIYGSRGANGVIVVTLKSGLEDYITTGESALNLSYDIDLPYTLLSNGKPQTALLKTIDVPAIYQYFSVPKLDPDVYLLAQVPDWNKLNLLPGEANIIVEGTYVGKTVIDPNSIKDTLNFTLGKDKRIVVKRDKVADFSSVKFLGTNKLQKFTYEITVKNNKKESVDLVLKDQFPLTTNKEIEVELIDAGNADVNHDLGKLDWKTSINAGESKKIHFTYSIKYPKDKSLNLN